MDLLAKIAADKEAADAASDKLDKIRLLVEEGARLQETIDSLNEALKATVGRFNRIKQFELPNVMKEANVGKHEDLDGRVKVKLDTYVSGSLPKDEHDKERALEYLVDAGGGALIKTELKVNFPKAMHNAALSFYAEVQELLKKEEYKPLDGNVGPDEPEFKESVHAQSLQAFARDKLKNGEELDFETLGLATGSIVKFEFFDDNGKRVKKKATEAE